MLFVGENCSSETHLVLPVVKGSALRMISKPTILASRPQTKDCLPESTVYMPQLMAAKHQTGAVQAALSTSPMTDTFANPTLPCPPQMLKEIHLLARRPTTMAINLPFATCADKQSGPSLESAGGQLKLPSSQIDDIHKSYRDSNALMTSRMPHLSGPANVIVANRKLPSTTAMCSAPRKTSVHCSSAEGDSAKYPSYGVEAQTCQATSDKISPTAKQGGNRFRMGMAYLRSRSQPRPPAVISAKLSCQGHGCTPLTTSSAGAFSEPLMPYQPRRPENLCCTIRHAPARLAGRERARRPADRGCNSQLLPVAEASKEELNSHTHKVTNTAATWYRGESCGIDVKPVQKQKASKQEDCAYSDGNPLGTNASLNTRQQDSGQKGTRRPTKSQLPRRRSLSGKSPNHKAANIIELERMKPGAYWKFPQESGAAMTNIRAGVMFRNVFAGKWSIAARRKARKSINGKKKRAKKRKENSAALRKPTTPSEENILVEKILQNVSIRGWLCEKDAASGSGRPAQLQKPARPGGCDVDNSQVNDPGAKAGDSVRNNAKQKPKIKKKRRPRRAQAPADSNTPKPTE